MKPFNVCPQCACVVDAPGAFCHRCQSKLESQWIVRVCAWLMLVILGAAVMATKCNGAEPITAKFMAKVAKLESGGNAKARGKAGELGKYQLKACAVAEVNRINGTKWKHRHALDPELSEYIAYAYLRICQKRSDGTPEGAYRKYRGIK